MSEKDYSSDSDAPVEVSHATSKASAIEQFKKVQAQQEIVREKSKAKRRAEIERNIIQKKAKKDKIKENKEKNEDENDNESLEAIPDDLLNTIAALKRGDIAIVQGDDDKSKRKIYKRTNNEIVNKLETEATSFNVIKFDEIDRPLVEQKNEIKSIQNFKNSSFFHNRSIKRSKAWQVSARKMKRKF